MQRDNCPNDQEIAFAHLWGTDSGYYQTDNDIFETMGEGAKEGAKYGYVSSLDPPYIRHRDCSRHAGS